MGTREAQEARFASKIPVLWASILDANILTVNRPLVGVIACKFLKSNGKIAAALSDLCPTGTADRSRER